MSKKQEKKMKKRKITISKIGIHFEVKTVGQISAHWIDLIGQGLDKNIFAHPYIRSMARFWVSLKEGLYFIIRGDFGGSKIKRKIK